MSIEILDPSHESVSRSFEVAARLDSLAGKTIGMISNGKKGTKPFFDAFEQELKTSYEVARVVRLTKANYSAPAEAAIMQTALEWDALVAGIGD